jgi:glutathione S-transferase
LICAAASETSAAMARPVLHIGNKNYSSWSLRPWLALKWGEIAFDEHLIPLGGEGYGRSMIKAVREISPSGRVPALSVDGAVIHESLAICEWAAEQTPALWPADAAERAQARAAATEMHAGFPALRRAMSMNIRRRLDTPPQWDDETLVDLERLHALWAELLGRSSGPFLFGRRSIADAMFAPVATRLRTYAVEISPQTQSYCKTIFSDAAFLEWERAAEAETWTIQQTEALYR